MQQIQHTPDLCHVLPETTAQPAPGRIDTDALRRDCALTVFRATGLAAALNESHLSNDRANGAVIDRLLDIVEAQGAEITTLRAKVDALAGLIKVAFIDGATAVHDVWSTGHLQRDPDFAETASDYATAVLTAHRETGEAGRG